MNPDSLLISAPGEASRLEHAKRFAQAFTSVNCARPRVLFGRNVYAKDLIKQFPIQAVVDDFTNESDFEGVPVIRSTEIPKDALVVALSGGRPLTVKDLLLSHGVEQLDYFAFLSVAECELRPIVFNEGFSDDYHANRDRYEWVHGLLGDEESRNTYRKLISFRYKSDIELLRGFTFREPFQYFEPFLSLRDRGEVFYDIGCFDGFTSREFIRHCPGYQAVHAFEPELSNAQVCQTNLSEFARVTVHPFGLSNAKAMLRMSAAGSGSVVTDDGLQTIRVEALDALDLPPPTFIKMDIEGAEPMALEGAQRTIARHHPRLAIAVYHQTKDYSPLWQVPEFILGIRDDYDIKLRHYTESIYETVMFFLPKRG